MKKRKRTFTPEFKAKVAFEAALERLSLAELSKKYSLYPAQLSQWKQMLVQGAPQLFERPSKRIKADLSSNETELERLHMIIGRQQVEIDFLKKSLSKVEAFNTRKI